MADRDPGDLYVPEELAKRFTYHAPTPAQAMVYPVIRDRAHELAQLLVSHCYATRELTLAVTRLEETVFWANAAIARHGLRSEAAESGRDAQLPG